MKHRVFYAAAIAAILLVGAGCAKRTTPQVTGLPAPQAPSTQKEAEVDTPAGAAAAIIKDMDIESGIYDDEDSDTDDTKAGTKEVSDFTDTTYDVSQ
jgi:hypothetical protein